MRYLSLICVGGASILLSSCGLYVIHKSTPAGDHKGIPFYVKTAACKHDVTRLEPYFVLTLTTKLGDKVQSTETTTLSRSQFNSKPVVDLRSALASATPDGGRLRILWDAVRAMHYEPHRPQDEIKDDDWLVISDTLTPEIYVDYQNPYTLNVRTPLIGSAKADVKLADDGTLNEASAEKEDKTISELFPIKELIKGAAGITTALEGGGTVTIELAIEEKGVKYTHRYHLTQLSPPCAASQEQRRETGPYDLIVEDMSAAKKEADENSITVSGSIKLPKQKDAKSTDNQKK